MAFLTRNKVLLGTGVVIAILAAVMLFTGGFKPFWGKPPEEETIEGVELTLLTNAGVMIEAGEYRIYIDPVDLSSDYGDSPADAVLITHDHGDHYQQSIISMLQKQGTVNVFPMIMEDEIELHEGTGVVPGSEVPLGPITITAFYMYTFSPTGTGTATHPAENNYTSYIVDIGGFTIFHAGDSKNIPEYEDLTGSVDVALLPLGPGCQTMAGYEVIDVLRVIEPGYFVPIHFTEGANSDFVSGYGTIIETDMECEICNLDHYSSYTFEIE